MILVTDDFSEMSQFSMATALLHCQAERGLEPLADSKLFAC